MKKSPRKQTGKVVSSKPFTTEEAKRFFGAINEQFNEKFLVIRERMDLTDEKMTRGFQEVNQKLDHHTDILNRHELILHEHGKKLDEHSKKLEEHSKKLDEHSKKFDEQGKKLDEHSGLLGRLLVDVEEIKSGMREKVSLAQFNALERRFVALESIVLTGGASTKSKARK